MKPDVLKSLLLPFLFLLAGFSSFSSDKPITIAISKSSSNYENWLVRADSLVNYLNLYPLSIDSAVKVLDRCHGLMITGGEDVHPAWYGKGSDTLRCTEMNLHRDSLDMALIARAMDKKMPIIGICRGEQILNVSQGGQLIIDIPQDFGTEIIHQCEDYLQCVHMVYVHPGTLLHQICGCDSAMVTTNHHQAVEVPAPALRGNAMSSDRLIEGIEWVNPVYQSFLLAVQWHPERMEPTNPLSGKLIAEFLRQCLRYRQR